MTAIFSNRTRTVLALLGLIALLAQFIIGSQVTAAAEATGNVYYVATNGNDSNPGTIEQPWKTIQKAAKTLQAGDTALIRGGTYVIGNKDEEIAPASSGTSDRYITFKAYAGENVTIQGNYPSLDDYVWFGINIKGQSYLQIEGLTIRGFHAGVFCQAPGHHIVIKNNTLEYNSESGVSSTGAVSGSKQACDYLTVLGNRIHHNGYYENGQVAIGPYEGWGSGVTIYPKNDPFAADGDYSQFHSIISGNMIYHNYDGTGGTQHGAGATTTSPANHTDGNGVIVDHGGNLPPILIENNVIFDNGGACVMAFGTQNMWVIGNTCYGNGADPLFIGPETKTEIGGFADPGDPPLKNIHILNNLVYATGSVQITYFPLVDSHELEIGNNLWFGQPYRETYSPYGAKYVRANPQLVNPTADPQTADFRLKPNSPAINIGANVVGMQLVDYQNAPRPQSRPQGSGYDAGAYEYTGEILAPTPVPPTGTLVRQVHLPIVAKIR